jgi:hypothetical protein
MRNAFKILAFLLITAFCCNFANIHVDNSRIQTEETPGNWLSVSPLDHGSQAIESRNLNDFFSSIPLPNFKNQKVTSILSKTAASIQVNGYKHYLFYATNLILRIETTDLIFPFHFFW